VKQSIHRVLQTLTSAIARPKFLKEIRYLASSLDAPRHSASNPEFAHLTRIFASETATSHFSTAVPKSLTLATPSYLKASSPMRYSGVFSESAD
jgi:hypothetical protein